MEGSEVRGSMVAQSSRRRRGGDTGEERNRRLFLSRQENRRATRETDRVKSRATRVTSAPARRFAADHRDDSQHAETLPDSFDASDVQTHGRKKIVYSRPARRHFAAANSENLRGSATTAPATPPDPARRPPATPPDAATARPQIRPPVRKTCVGVGHPARIVGKTYPGPS